MPRRLSYGLDVALAIAVIAIVPVMSGKSAHAIDLGCEGVKIEVNVDALSLDQYQAVVKEHQCKCLKMQDKCIAAVPRPVVTNDTPTTPPVTPPVVSTAPPVVPAPNATRKFTLYDGRDVGGSDYKVLKDNTSQDLCIEQCKQDNKCVAFSWDRWNNYCFLKQVAPTFARIDPQSMAAVVSTEQQPTDSHTQVQMERFYNAEFRDKPYTTTRDGSYKDCEQTCRKDDGCEVFTYQTKARTCGLIRRPYQYYRLGKRSDRHTVDDCIAQVLPVCSGVKRQTAP